MTDLSDAPKTPKFLAGTVVFNNVHDWHLILCVGKKKYFVKTPDGQEYSIPIEIMDRDWQEKLLKVE